VHWKLHVDRFYSCFPGYRFGPKMGLFPKIPLIIVSEFVSTNRPIRTMRPPLTSEIMLTWSITVQLPSLSEYILLVTFLMPIEIWPIARADTRNGMPRPRE